MRLEVLKTYKIYIGGKFPRTESGRYYKLKVASKTIANICQCSRKDFREAVVVARKAQEGWNEKSAFNRSQILYRIAEILEGRKTQFIEEMLLMGISKSVAEKEVVSSVDRLVYFAGWCDKYQQVFSGVNPVASSHFNFSVNEPMGLIASFVPENSPLLGLVSIIAAQISGGNSSIVLASEKYPLTAITFAEVLNSSDVPGGVVNILTGFRKELVEHFSTHMDVNAVVYCGTDKKEIELFQKNAATNMKRVSIYSDKEVLADEFENPYEILKSQEVKTTWHPIEKIGGASPSY
jgi:acyl-CoA reductase-like NAD-dependent aldehyde dehydrogenase